MNFNATVIGQMIAFGIFVAFCMRFIWPHIIKALEERKTTIADGLAAAEQGQKELAEAQERYTELVQEGKQKVRDLLSRAQKHGDEIIEQSKQEAQHEGEQLLSAARLEIALEREKAKEALRQQVAGLAVLGAEKILLRELDAQTHQKMLDEVSQSL